jgi:hypothetical protein
LKAADTKAFVLPWLPERREDLEWLDLGQGSEQEVAANLAEMARINRWLGGDRALFQHLLPRIQARPGRTRIVDLGTGSGSLPARIACWAGQHQVDVQAIGVDWAGRNLRVGAKAIEAAAGIRLVQADAARVPLAPGCADYVISSLFLHHFPPRALIPLLRSAFDLSAHGIVMSDLVRGWAPWFLFRLGQPVIARNRLTRHDGALSILRAYRPAELADLARQAGLPNPQVYSHWPWRMTLVVDK